MRKLMNGAAALAVAASAAASASAGVAGGAAEPVECHIDVARANGGVTLVATAASATRATAEWRFTVSGSGGGGTSRMTQSGTVSLAGGRPEILGEVGLGAGGQYEATLELFSPAGNASCRTASR